MLKKKIKVGSITILGFKLYYKAVIIKIVLYWHKNRYIEYWNRIENPEMDQQIYGQLIFDKAGKSTQWKKDSQRANGGRTGQQHSKDETRPLSYTIHKNKLEMDKGPECETGNHQNHTGENRQHIFDLGYSNFLLDMSLEAREIKAKMNYWDLIKINT